MSNIHLNGGCIPTVYLPIIKTKNSGDPDVACDTTVKKYLTEHESETLSTCYDKYLASCQDAQRPLSKTASLPEGKCILLLYLVLLSTVQQWVHALASDRNVGHDFTLPLSCSVYAYSICHQGTTPGAVGIEGGKAYDVGWNNTPVWIIAIGSM